MKIILGSQSVSRQRILTRAGYEFEVMSADIDEKAIRSENIKELVIMLANAKADALLKVINEPTILITADQIVVCNGEAREKPIDADEAKRFLRSYAEHPVEALNGIAVVNTGNGKRVTRFDISTVKFQPISEGIIKRLIEQGNIFNQAGAFSAEDPLLESSIEYIDGTIDSIEGLPMDVVKEMIIQVS